MLWNPSVWCGYTGNKHNICSVNSFMFFFFPSESFWSSSYHFFSGTTGSCSQTVYLPQPLCHCIFIMRPETSQLARALLIGYLNYIRSFADPCFIYNSGIGEKKRISCSTICQGTPAIILFLLTVQILNNRLCLWNSVAAPPPLNSPGLDHWGLGHGVKVNTRKCWPKGKRVPK